MSRNDGTSRPGPSTRSAAPDRRRLPTRPVARGVRLALLAAAMAGLADPSPVGGPARAEEPAGASVQAIPSLPDLIEALRADDPADRAAAADALRRRGEAAIPRLEAAGARADLETRLRVERIVATIRADALRARTADFLAGRTDGADLPAWPPFVALTGDTRAARQLFVRLGERHGRLLAAIAGADHRQREGLFQIHFGGVVTRALRQDEVPAEDLALLFFGGTRVANWSDDVSRMARLQYALQPDRLGRLVVAPGGDPILRRLAEAWVEHVVALGPDRDPAPRALLIATDLGLIDCVLRAVRRVLAAPEVEEAYLETYLLLLGRHGSAGDRPLIARFLDDGRELGVFSNPGRDTYTSLEVRDVALAVTIHLAGEDPRDFGYAELAEYEPTLYKLTSLGFSRADRRAEARARWDAHVAGRGVAPGPAPRPPGGTAPPIGVPTPAPPPRR